MKDSIRNICEEWRVKTTTEEGFTYNSETARYELHRHGIEPHLINFEELVCFGVEVSKNLLVGRLSSFETKDHKLFWLYASSLISDYHPGNQSHLMRDDPELFQLFNTCTSLLFMEHQPSASMGNSTPQSFNPSLLASYMFFPLLETLSRRIASEYISEDGVVIKEFCVDGISYLPTGKRKCSSLKHILHLAVSRVEPDSLRAGISELIQNLEKFSSDDKDGYAFLYELRNSALHAGVAVATIGGYAASIAMLLGLNIYKDRFENSRKFINESIVYLRAQNFSPPCWFAIYAKNFSAQPRQLGSD